MVVPSDTSALEVLRRPLESALCAFVRGPGKLPDYRLYEVVVDAADPVRIASWWADRFVADVHHDHDQGFSWLEGAPGMPWEMVFTRVPEPKTVKNRLHWDVQGDVGELLDAGARLLRARDGEIGWNVMADPEGNEFCVFDPHGR